MDESQAPFGRGASHVVLDGDTLFWAAADGSVHASDGAERILVPPGWVTGPLAVDASNVYYTSDTGVFSVPRKAGPETLAFDTPARGLAADASGIYALYIVPTVGQDRVKTVWRVAHVDPDGLRSELFTLVLPGRASPPTFGIDNHDVFIAIPASVSNQGVATDGQVVRVPKGGGLPTTIGTGLGYPVRLTVDATRVYITEIPATDGSFQGSRLIALPKEGGNLETIATLDGRLLGALSVDAENAYVVATDEAHNPDSSSLFRIALDGTSQTELAREPLKNYSSIAVGLDAIYLGLAWRPNASPPPVETTSIRKLCH